MHDARAIANYFLDRAEARGIKLTLMTLLKVLYFAHAWYLARTDKPLIAQHFEAWQYGPVNRLVYDQFKGLGKKPIESLALSFDPLTVSFRPAEYNINAETSIFIDNIFDYYCDFDPFRLS